MNPLEPASVGSGVIARLPACALVLMSAGFTIAYLCGCTLLDQAPVLSDPYVLHFDLRVTNKKPETRLFGNITCPVIGTIAFSPTPGSNNFLGSANTTGVSPAPVSGLAAKDAAVRQRDPHRRNFLTGARRLCQGGPESKQVRPLAGILGTDDIPGRRIHQRVGPIAEKPVLGEVGRIELFAHLHVLDPDRRDQKLDPAPRPSAIVGRVCVLTEIVP